MVLLVFTVFWTGQPLLKRRRGRSGIVSVYGILDRATVIKKKKGS